MSMCQDQDSDQTQADRHDTNTSSRCSWGRLKTLYRANDMESSSHVLRELIAEFTGSAILVIFGCGSAISVEAEQKPLVTSIAIGYGLAVSTVIWCFGHISGAQVNPCVSIAMLVTRKMSLLKTLLYGVVQCFGATAGAGILLGVTPETYRGTLGAPLLSPNISTSQGFGVEFVTSFVLVLAIFATSDSQRVDHTGCRALSTGLVVTMAVLWAYQYTGASMNPARSLGPAIVMSIWDDHWIYWLGPVLGAVVAGVMYDNLFAVNASITKTRSCLMATHYKDYDFNDMELILRHNNNDIDNGVLPPHVNDKPTRTHVNHSPPSFNI